MTDLLYVAESSRPFGETVNKGFRVLHTHDLAATLAEKGFPRESMKIIEICNARYASEALTKDIRLAVMLPCSHLCVHGKRQDIHQHVPPFGDSQFLSRSAR